MIRRMLAALAASASFVACRADSPPSQEGLFIARDFRFHTGEVLPEVKLAYRTLGSPEGEPVLVLHGTAGSAATMLTPAFAGELFGPGQPLDTAKYYVIIPDTLGHGKSSKPFDGLRTKFPRYDYADMVEAHHRLLTEHLKVKHLRMVIGNSMGGMETWLYATGHPGFMDIAVPMACLPTAMASRNWMLRRLITDSIRNDPAWHGGDYTLQPPSARFASVFFAVATNGGSQALYKAAPTREKADAFLDARLAAPFAADANDVLYQWDSSGDYDPAPALDRVTAAVLAINAADDERNPPELGLLDREMQRVKNGRVLLIPASAETAGHGTTGSARWYKRDLAQLLQSAPRIP